MAIEHASAKVFTQPFPVPTRQGTRPNRQDHQNPVVGSPRNWSPSPQVDGRIGPEQGKVANKPGYRPNLGPIKSDRRPELFSSLETLGIQV
ncbi:hypothetical protein N7539_007782 [Penicillium diatomitis]|uniref:Uncharacterized protein n=1 Tax=Penicillium diatomitis TaxID=2819901 RepID=A0A9X0BNA1_9EURO|nr:uncharacterized protein N7539_007782 [Penicillium diatomitis]KAJ5475495.1 hypothetical protein N7539_007782 [Penicillium diatomitis]